MVGVGAGLGTEVLAGVGAGVLPGAPLDWLVPLLARRFRMVAPPASVVAVSAAGRPLTVKATVMPAVGTRRPEYLPVASTSAMPIFTPCHTAATTAPWGAGLSSINASPEKT